MKLRPYDLLTPKERQQRAKPALPTRQCSKCGGSNVRNIDGMEWILDQDAMDGIYVRRCGDCGNVEQATRKELAAARAQDSDPPSTQRSQENSGSQSTDVGADAQEESVDAGVTDTSVSLAELDDIVHFTVGGVVGPIGGRWYRLEDLMFLQGDEGEP